MPSPTAVSENIRKRKRAKQGRSRKKANAKRGTINFFKAFSTPAMDEPSKKAS